MWSDSRLEVASGNTVQLYCRVESEKSSLVEWFEVDDEVEPLARHLVQDSPYYKVSLFVLNPPIFMLTNVRT